jgi:hypothetical protein
MVVGRRVEGRDAAVGVRQCMRAGGEPRESERK